MQSRAVPHDGEGVRADAVGHRLDQGQGDRGGQRRVDRAAAVGEHRQAGLRGQRLGRAHHIARQHGFAWPGVGQVPRERDSHWRNPKSRHSPERSVTARAGLSPNTCDTTVVEVIKNSGWEVEATARISEPPGR